MPAPNTSSNHREAPRVSSALPVNLIFGSQITLLGQVKDLSLKSAFIRVKSSIHMAIHDELEFNINSSIQGFARISRVAPGEGIAIYFTKIDEASSSRLQQLVGVAV